MMPTVAAINNLGEYANNPRGNLWINDESTYGRKLLMKMGWSHGKGLGKNEDGIKENLSVKFRNTNSGLGFKDDSYANVMKTEYESILKSLSDTWSQNENCTVPKKTDKQENKISEQKSRLGKGRVRYPKLFFGKDVSKYSEKDMKSIFICSLPSTDNEQEILEGPGVSQKQKSESELPKIVETYSSTLSISEYFAKKMEEKKSAVLNGEDCNDSNQQKASDTEILQTDVLSKKTKSKKRKKNSELSTNTEFVNDSCLVHAEDEEHEYAIPKKKKCKLSDLVCRTDVSKNCKILEVGETLHDNSCMPNKKQKKSQLFENDAHRNKISCQIELSSNTVLQLNKKKKNDLKNKHKSSDTVQLVVENPMYKEKSVENSLSNDHTSSGTVEDELSNGNVYSKKKKKPKKIKLKKIKSCLKSKSGTYSVKNVSFNESVSYRVIDSDSEFVDCLSEKSSAVQNDLTREIFGVDDAVDGAVDDAKSKLENNISASQEESSREQTCNSDSAREEQERVSAEESEQGCSLSGLPSPKSPHYNYWIESQRLALKMEMYKNMLKSIKKHKILKTSNLLSVKGYGNWGFK